MSVKEFFYLIRAERKIVTVVAALAVVALSLLFVLGDDADSTLADSLGSTADSIRTARRQHAEKTYTYATGEMPHERFDFDPNTADSTALLRLGLQPWQVQAIYKYRAHGGVYRTPADFARVYGLTAKQYRELEPYIHISDDYRPAAELIATRAEEAMPDTVRRPHKIGDNERVDVNTADTALLQRVPGIGPYFARQIVYHRKQLGGFASVAQMKEIDGFPEASLRYFTASAEHITRLKVNKLTLAELRRHPYINFYQARAITDYRRTKGPLKSLNDLRLLREYFSEQDLKRMAPYVEF